jgi:quinol monooxygenase YgiN
VRYGYLTTLRAKPGHRDDVVALLLTATDGLRSAGCDVYAVNTAADDPDTIWVYEVWLSKEHHDASLRLPETRAAIAKAMPILTPELTGRELDLAGGLGVPSDS